MRVVRASLCVEASERAFIQMRRTGRGRRRGKKEQNFEKSVRRKALLDNPYITLPERFP